MASSLSSPCDTSSSSDVTQCPVCSEDFSQEKNTPKFLPCAHLVCRECLATRIKQPRATCPVCQGRFLTLSDLDPNTLNDLDPNHDAERSTEKIPTDQAARALANASKLLREEPECGACGYVIGVTSYCFHCRMKLCRKCSDMHAKFPAFQTHKVHPLSKLSAQRLAVGGHATCRQHSDRPAELFCPAHCRPICIACVPDHTKCGGVQVLQEAAEDERERLDVWAQRLLLAGTDMQDKAAHLEKQRDESKQQFQRLRDTVTKRVNILHEALDSRKRHLLSLIHNQETQLAESVSSQLLPLRELSPLLLSHGEAGKRVVSTASDGDLLEMAAEILLPRWKELEMRSSDDVTRAFRQQKVLKVDESVFEDLKSRIVRLGFVSEDRGSASNEAFAVARDGAASGIATFCAEDEKVKVGDNVKVVADFKGEEVRADLEGQGVANSNRESVKVCANSNCDEEESVAHINIDVNRNRGLDSKVVPMSDKDGAKVVLDNNGNYGKKSVHADPGTLHYDMPTSKADPTFSESLCSSKNPLPVQASVIDRCRETNPRRSSGEGYAMPAHPSEATSSVLDAHLSANATSSNALHTKLSANATSNIALDAQTSVETSKNALLLDQPSQQNSAIATSNNALHAQPSPNATSKDALPSAETSKNALLTQPSPNATSKNALPSAETSKNVLLTQTSAVATSKKAKSPEANDITVENLVLMSSRLQTMIEQHFQHDDQKRDPNRDFDKALALAPPSSDDSELTNPNVARDAAPPIREAVSDRPRPLDNDEPMGVNVTVSPIQKDRLRPLDNDEPMGVNVPLSGDRRLSLISGMICGHMTPGIQSAKRI